MTSIYDISDRFVDNLSSLNPILAASLGITGHETKLGDFSPEGSTRNAELVKNTLLDLGSQSPLTHRDKIAKEVMVEQLSIDLALYEMREHYRDLNIMHSPLQSVRMVFDQMPRTTEHEWENIAGRLNRIPAALNDYKKTLSDGVSRGLVSTVRQVTGCAEQAQTWSGNNDQPSFFSTLVKDFSLSAIKSNSLTKDLQSGIRVAEEAYGNMSEYLLTDYLPNANKRDGVGPERYAVMAERYNGILLDLPQTYEWGWEQLQWVDKEMTSTANKILPSEHLSDVLELLESDPERAIDGVTNFQQWMQELQDETIKTLNHKHFEIAEPVKKIEAMIAPAGGALAMYYTRPSADFSRPGRTWYPTGGKTRFPIWGEVSIAYHEGVPGHHFQLGTTIHMSDQLSRFQRLLGGTSGYIEGWALYAERLMGELGYLDNPDYYLGMLRAQALRSVRVILDIGMHLELKIPDDSSFHPGEYWTPDLGLEFVKARSHFPSNFVSSEIDRYLGIPGQAISYKVGERVWLESRDIAKSKLGSSFNLKKWHTKALGLGGMGLSQMQRELGSA